MLSTSLSPLVNAQLNREHAYYCYQDASFHQSLQLRLVSAHREHMNILAIHITKCIVLNTESFGLEETSRDHPPQPCPNQDRVPQSKLLRNVSRYVSNVFRGGAFTTSLGSMFQCSAILDVKKFFLMLRWKHWNIYTEKSSVLMALSAEFLLSFTEVNIHQSIVTSQNKPFPFFS